MTQGTQGQTDSDERAPEQAEAVGGDRPDTAADTAANMTRKATGQGMDMIQNSLRMLTDMHRPAVDIMHDHGLRAADAVAQLTGACHKAAEATAGDIHALASAYMRLGCGMQEAQHAWADLWQRSMTRLVQEQQSLLACRSTADVAQLQQRMLRDSVSFMVQAGAELLRVRSDVAQSAAQPLQDRVRQERG